MAILTAPGALAATNLLTNGDFEQSGGALTGWAGADATLTLAGDGAGGGHAGRAALAGGASAYSLKSSPKPVSATQGTVYTLDGLIRSDTPGRPVCAKIGESGTLSGSTVSCGTSTSAWAPLPEISYTAKATGDKLVAWVTQKSAVTGNSFEADNLSLTAAGGKPAAPASLHTTNVVSNEVDLAWTSSPTSGVTSYTLYRGADCTSLSQIATVTATLTSYADTSVLASTSFAYSVDASSDGVVHSTASNCLSVTTPASGVPASPTNLHTTKVLSSEVDLAWDASPSAAVTSYTVYRGADCMSLSQIATVNAAPTTYADGSVLASATYAYSVDASADGITHSAATNCLPVTTPAIPVSPPTIAAVGDISCDPVDVNFNSGNGQNKKCAEKATGALVGAGPSPGHPFDAVLPLGDLQYECGSLAKFNASYDPAWGMFSAQAYPALGNHEYKTTDANATPDPACDSTASGYFRYFANYGNPNYLGVNGLGYYSGTIGTWHVIALNSNCANLPFSGTQKDGCDIGSPQEIWLKNDLASPAAQTACTLAFWHHAPWSSQGSSQGVTSMRRIWADLANAGVDLVLTGHFHHYERLADMNASGVAVADGKGTREIIAGTGGEDLTGFNSTAFPASRVRNSSTFGILSVTLGTGSYSWRFIPAAPGTFTDSGTDTCH
jgi:hypothetical protein